jgi:hypothetical protein
MERNKGGRASARAATMMKFRASNSRLVPKGLQDSARGFNPWKQVNTATRPEGAEAICERRSVWSTSLHLRHRFYRPFSTSNPAVAGCNSNKPVMNDCLVRAGFFLNQHLGLKPQAESSCPFGASTTRCADAILMWAVPVLQRSFQPEPTIACPTKPKLYIADRSSWPRNLSSVANRLDLARSNVGLASKAALHGVSACRRRKRGAPHKVDAGEVGRTRTKPKFILPALHLSPFTFHLSHSSFRPCAH